VSDEIDITLRIPETKWTVSPVAVRRLSDDRYELRESVLGSEDLGLIPEAIIECSEDPDAEAPRSASGADTRPALAFSKLLQPSKLHMYQVCIARRLAESDVFARWIQRLIDEGCYVFRDLGGVVSVYYRDAGRDPRAEINGLFAELDQAEQRPTP
jgi:hypothetical protein